MSSSSSLSDVSFVFQLAPKLHQSMNCLADVAHSLVPHSTQLDPLEEDTMDEDSDNYYNDDDDDDSDIILAAEDEDDEDGAFGNVGDDAFSQDASGKAKKQLFEVDFTCHTLEGLKLQQKKEVDQVAAMFMMKVSTRELSSSVPPRIVR